MSTRALQFDILLLGFRDPATDSVLSGGTVNFLSAGTSNPATVWDEKEKTNARTSVTLDPNGQAQVYGDGVYKLEILDANDVPVSYSPLDNIKIRAVSTNVVETNTTYTATTDDDLILCDTSGGTVLINLYPAADFISSLTIKNVSSAGNDVTVDAFGSELIDGSPTDTLTDGQTQEYFSNGAGWFGSGQTTGTTLTTTSLVPTPQDNGNGTFTVNGALIDVQVFTVSGTWTKPDNTNAVEVLCVGGGGAGGGVSAATNSAGGGGGAGGAAQKFSTSGLGVIETVTVGTGGLGVSASTGNPGNSSIFGAHASAGGGTGGNAGDGVISSTGIDAIGGSGSSGGTGDISIAGSDGTTGSVIATSFVAAGQGGSSSIAVPRYGGTTIYDVYSGPGSGTGRTPAPGSFGCGASGAFNTGTTNALAGGNGADGVVVVKSYT